LPKWERKNRLRYRELGKTGESISILSLGCMRFPSKEVAVEIVAKAVELGINYFETSIGYVGGNSERWLGRGLGEAREKVMVSTKSHPTADGEGVSADGVRRAIDESLAKLGTDYVDFYHGWSVSRPKQYEACVRKGGWFDGVHRAKEEGLVKHIGVTTHAPPGLVMRMIDDGRWEVITVQYSLILQGYRDVVKAAHQKGIGVVVMGPLAGGLLALPSDLLKRVFAPQDQVAGALRYVLCDPGVSSVASGMTAVEEVEMNCAIIDALPQRMTIAHQEAIDARLSAELGEGLAQFESFFCGGCRYCLSVCPENIGPHNIFKAYNIVMLKGEPSNPQDIAQRAQNLLDRCIHCGECQEICPQDIDVPEHLERVRDYFLAQAASQ
jgi:predicted aldo/keto reductase-like oxidoreductase